MKIGPIILETSQIMKRANIQVTDNESNRDLELCDLPNDILSVVFKDNLCGFILAKQLCSRFNDMLPDIESVAELWVETLTNFDEEEGVDIVETLVGGVHHSVNGKPSIVYLEYDDEEGIVLEELIFHRRGRMHREGGPAWAKAERGRIMFHNYYANGLKHRVGEPAVIQYVYANDTDNDPAVESTFYHFGVIHNEYGPAIIKANNAMSLRYMCEMYYINGFLHRTDGPASIECFNGEMVLRHYVDGVETEGDNSWPGYGWGIESGFSLEWDF
jgi:hypothetical protein